MIDRTIRITADMLEKAKHCNGRAALFPVQVNWPELRLTEQQIFENAVAHAYGHRAPHPDPSIITIEVERTI